jgi:hypothetical protein
MARTRSPLSWLVTVHNGTEVVSALPVPGVREAVALAVAVRRCWPGLRVSARRYPRAQTLTVLRQGRACARQLVSGGRAA